MTREEKRVIRAAMRRVFADGQQWGVTYSTWFEPTAEDTERQARKSLNRACAALRKREK